MAKTKQHRIRRVIGVLCFVPILVMGFVVFALYANAWGIASLLIKALTWCRETLEKSAIALVDLVGTPILHFGDWTHCPDLYGSLQGFHAKMED